MLSKEFGHHVSAWSSFDIVFSSDSAMTLQNTNLSKPAEFVTSLGANSNAISIAANQRACEGIVLGFVAHRMSY